MKYKNINKKILYVIGILVSLLYISPFYILIVNSFKTKREIFQSTVNLPSVFNLENFKIAADRLSLLWLKDFRGNINIFGSSLFNSLFITVGAVSIIVVLSSMAAWMLVRTKSKMSTVIFFMFISAMLVPFQAVMLPLVALSGLLGMQNQFGLIFMYLGFGSSLSIFLYHGFIKSLPLSVEEAAIVDGCSPWQVYWKIVFPMLKPIHITVASLNVIAIWNDYLLPSLMVNKTGMQTIPLQMFFFFGGYTKEWNLAMAGLLIAIIPIVIFYFIAQKHIIEGITAGANK